MLSPGEIPQSLVFSLVSECGHFIQPARGVHVAYPNLALACDSL